MHKSLTGQQVAATRRTNSMLLAIIFAIIAPIIAFAFGYKVLFVIAFLSLPLLVTKIWEEVRTQYVFKKPHNLRK